MSLNSLGLEGRLVGCESQERARLINIRDFMSRLRVGGDGNMSDHVGVWTGGGEN